MPKVRRLGERGRLGRRHRLRRRARPGREGARGCAGAGKLVVGGTPYTDRLEDDRAFGQQELKAAGVADHPAGELHLVRRRDRLRAREPEPLRDQAERRGAERTSSCLFVGEDDDGKDVLQVLEDYKRAWSDKIKEFQLQRRIVGVEVAAGAFFNGKRVRLPDQRQLRAQEAVPRRHRAVDRRDGHGDVLERAQQDLQRRR